MLFTKWSSKIMPRDLLPLISADHREQENFFVITPQLDNNRSLLSSSSLLSNKTLIFPKELVGKEDSLQTNETTQQQYQTECCTSERNHVAIETSDFPHVDDASIIQCGRTEWRAAETLVTLNCEKKISASSTNNTQTSRIKFFGPVSPTEATVAPSFYCINSSKILKMNMAKGKDIVDNVVISAPCPLHINHEKVEGSEKNSSVEDTRIVTLTPVKKYPSAENGIISCANPSAEAKCQQQQERPSVVSRKPFKSETHQQEQVIFYAPPASVGGVKGRSSDDATGSSNIPPSQPASSLHPLYRERSIEETEAAHDLLSLSQSLPPLPAPCVVTILKQENQQTPNSNSPFMNSTTMPVMQEISNAPMHSHVHQYYEKYSIRANCESKPSLQPSHCLPTIRYSSYESNAENCSPLTPPISEHSSDIEIEISSSASSASSESSVSPRIGRKFQPQKDLWNPELIKIKQEPISFMADGRSKPRKSQQHQNSKTSEGGSSAKSSRSRKGNYKCSDCGRQYATSSNLSRHKQTHRSLDSQSAKKCNTCGKAYVSMPALAMHLLTHKLTHSCDICGKLFSRPWLLQGHLRSHTGEKPYQCMHCGKAFADRSNLRAHMQTHSSDKNYKCVRCQKTFALKSYLNKHLESSCLKDRDSVMSSDDNDEDIIVT